MPLPVTMKTHIYNCCAQVRDFLLLALLAINLAVQIICTMYFSVKYPFIWKQCKNISIFTYGIVADLTAMAILVTLSSIIMYTIRRSNYDVVTTVVTLFSFAWLLFAGIGSWLSRFDCRSQNYPFTYLVILLSVNAVLGCAILIFGRKHAHKLAKGTKSEEHPVLQTTSVAPTGPIEISNGNETFTQFSRRQTHGDMYGTIDPRYPFGNPYVQSQPIPVPTATPGYRVPRLNRYLSLERPPRLFPQY